jgi:uncharacterized protein YqgC (DUF456 family)
MEIALVISAFLFLLVGLIGALVPVIPGPPLSFIGLLLLQWSGYGGFTTTFLLLLAALTIAVMVMDYFLPALFTKKFGGSRIAVIGSVLGLIIGVIFFAPVGVIIGPFLGAFAGEMINLSFRQQPTVPPLKQLEDQETQAERGEVNVTEADTSPTIKALKVALGAFLAFILGTGAKLIICMLMIYYAIRAVVA